MKNGFRQGIKPVLACLFFVWFGSVACGQDHDTIKVSDDISLVRISDNAWVHISYSTLPGFGSFASNGLVYANGRKAILFDAPVTEALTETLVSWLQDSMKLKIIAFVPNHWHNDCMGGLGYIQKIGIKSYSSLKTIEIAKANNLPVPANGFSDVLTLNLGRKKIECFFPGPAHSMDNIVAWIPSEKILFAGCMVKSIDSHNLGNTSDGDLLSYPETIEKLIRRYPNAEIVIPGHGAFGGRELLTHTLELSRK